MRLTDRFEPIVLQARQGTNNQAFDFPRQQRSYRLVSLHCTVGGDNPIAAVPLVLLLAHQIQLGGGNTLNLGNYTIEYLATSGFVSESTFATGVVDRFGTDTLYSRAAIPTDLVVEPSESLLLALEGNVNSETIQNVTAVVKWLTSPDPST